VALCSYRYFYERITKLTADTDAPYTSLVFRGHRRIDWKLEPRLDRELRKIGKLKWPGIREDHLGRFKYAMRGRRGSNPARDLPDDEWWSLGQHHGLDTPLLDWTASPFVAAYFAYCEEKPQDEKRSCSDRRCIFALCQNSVEMMNEKLEKGMRAGEKRKTVKFVRPLTDENPRLVSQAGLFTHAPDGVLVEVWIKEHFASSISPQLLKITFPESDREMALRSLNLMNINHLTLFPDSYGASKVCNFRLRIPHY
jgi:hypothetical protein